MENKVICVRPFSTIYNLPERNYSPCCWAKSLELGPHDVLPIDYFDGDEFRRIRKEMLLGEKTDFLSNLCKICHNLEKKYEHSPRQMLPVTEDILNNFNPDGSLKKLHNRFITIAINIYENFCNLECYECTPKSSTSRKFALKKIDPKWMQINGFEISNPEPLNKEQFNNIVSQIINCSNIISHIEIVGGEPMLMHQHFKLLDALILCGQSKFISLTYVSNMTLMTIDKMQKYFDNFKYTDIKWSVDALEKRNYWLRYPTDWDSTIANVFDVQKYFNKTNKGSINATITPSLLSIVTFRKTYLWLYHKKLILPQKLSSNIICNPKILQIKNLPDELKNKIANSVKFVSQFHYNDLMQERNEEEFNLAIDYCDALDKSRGTDWRSTFPEVAKYAN